MKAIIEIDFNSIARVKADDNFINKHPEIKKSAIILMDNLVKETQKFLKSKKIDTKITYKLEYENE